MAFNEMTDLYRKLSACEIEPIEIAGPVIIVGFRHCP